MEDLKNLKSVSDHLTREKILDMHPLVRQEVINGIVSAEQTGLRIRIVQALKTFQEQKRIYEQGRSTPGPIVSWAKPGFSYHNYGLAFDFCLLKDGKKITWQRSEFLEDALKADFYDVAFVFKNLGWVWGGDFPDDKKDYPHLHKTLGFSILQLFEKHEAGVYGPDRFLLLN